MSTREPARQEPTETADFLRAIVDELAGEIGARPYDDLSRLGQAAERIEGWFGSGGLAVSSQAFAYRGRTYRNLIADIAGAEQPGSILVVGAHYDTVSGSPGADDNTSGVAGLLGLARALAGHRLRKTVRFVAFALEEPPVFRTRNMGSYHHALSLREGGARVEGMVCLEMIGYFSDRPGSQGFPLPFMSRKYPKTGNYIAMVGNRRSAGFTREMADGFRAGTDLPLMTLNAPAVVVGIDFSDHWAYGKLGFRSFMVTDTAFYRNPHYHTPHDLPGTLDYRRMAKVVEGLRGSIESWDRR